MDRPGARPDEHGDEALDGHDDARRTPKDPGGSGELAGGERRARATRPLGIATIVVIAAALGLAIVGGLWYLFR